MVDTGFYEDESYWNKRHSIIYDEEQAHGALSIENTVEKVFGNRVEWKKELVGWSHCLVILTHTIQRIRTEDRKGLQLNHSSNASQEEISESI